MIRVVVDTNVPVSAALRHGGNEDHVASHVLSGRLALFVTDAIVAEYRTVLLRPKFAFIAERVENLLMGLTRRGTRVLPATEAVASPNPDDTKFIACAVAARADFLVTGNRRHFPEPAYGTAAVVNARQLLDRLAAPP